MYNSDFLYKKPLITIGITCFNASGTIFRALKSALNQDWPNFEILIVDDFSNDNSIDIISKFIKKHKNIRLIQHKKNLGCSQARNTIVSGAKGKFIAFFDDDDFSLSNRLSLQYKRITEYEKIHKTKFIACYSSVLRIYPNGYVKEINSVGSLNSMEIIGKEMSEFLLFNKKSKKLFYGSGTPSCCFMARKEVFQKVGKFDKKLLRQEDIDFAIRLGFKGGHFIGVSEKVLKQYYTEDLNKNPSSEFDSSIRILTKNSVYLKKKKVYDYMINWTKLRYFHFTSQFINFYFLLIKLLLRYPLRTMNHISKSGFKRFIHEYRIKSK